MLALLGLHDDYRSDGRVLVSALRSGATPRALKRHGDTVRALGDVYERLNASFDEWWERTMALAGPLAAILAALPEEAVNALHERARAAVRPYETASGGLDFPGETLIATARRA